jgi:glucose-1-phosphate thymidylyltransferase
MRVKVASHYLLERMRHAGVRRAFFILRKGKWDIPDYYGDGTSCGMDLGYLITRVPYGPAYTLDQAYPFVRGARVAFGFPDILFKPADAFTRALARLTATRASLVLGLYRARDSWAEDMVDIDRKGRVLELVIKPGPTNLRLGWILAVWRPTFTEFLHDYLPVPTTERPNIAPAEITLGQVIQAAVREGLVTQSVSFPRHSYLDVGTPDALRRVLRRMPSIGPPTDRRARGRARRQITNASQATGMNT